MKFWSHVEECIEDNNKKLMQELKKQEITGNKKKQFGRGSLVTFLSKKFINKLIDKLTLERKWY